MRTAPSLPYRGSLSGRGGLSGRRPLPVNRMTDACENITSPQTSFAGVNEGLLEHALKPKTYVHKI